LKKFRTSEFNDRHGTKLNSLGTDFSGILVARPQRSKIVIPRESNSPVLLTPDCLLHLERSAKQ
jgi:hypothetical protein